MIIDIPNRPDKGGNTGSVVKLAHYLEKENQGKATEDKAWFFDQNRDAVGVTEVISTIDGNKKGLKAKDAKFYLLNIAPSEKELQHIGNDPEKLREYTRAVMDIYAKNFNRGIIGDDLLYFAKIEQERSYKGYDQAVKVGNAKQGDIKPGLQTHIHIIVSRKDRYGERQFSPLSNHRNTDKGVVRGGFDRKQLYMQAEEKFDELTGYDRPLTETFRYRNAMKTGTAREKFAMQQELQAELPTRQPGLTLLGTAIKSGTRDYDPDETSI